MEDLILEKATQLFLSRGFKTVTMDEIAAELSISKKTIYQHYTSKPELIEKCLVHLNTIVLNALESAITEDKTAIEEIIAATDAVAKVCEMDTFDSLYQLRKYYPKIEQKQRALHRKSYVTIIEKNLVKGIKEGVYRADLDVEFIARLHIISMSSLNDRDYYNPKKFNSQELHDLYQIHHMRAITTEKGMKQFTELNKNR